MDAIETARVLGNRGETADHIAALAARLRAAYDSGPVPPLRDGLEPLDAAGAYAIQACNTRVWEQGGRIVSGRKVGLTAPAVRAQLGVDQPDYGVLFADMQIESGGVLRRDRVWQPKAEAEIALVLGRDVSDPAIDDAGIAAATDYAVTAIEIVDSRIADWRITFADTVADNGSAGCYVLGTEKRTLAGLDLYTCGMVLEVNGAPASLGVGAACLGHPLKAAAWLARTLAARGEALRAGDVVLTGALGPVVPLQAGDEVRARIGGVGTTSFTFEDAGR